MHRLILAAALALTTTAAMADETWSSDMGEIVYLDEQDGAAIFTFTNVDGTPARLVIPGLAGNYSNRDTHRAYWTGVGPNNCGALLSEPGQAPSANWGQALISFDKPAFPTSFTLTLGWCFDPLSTAIRAETNAR
ncbi:hypothetical protein [Thalassococcus lentus]|uniref:Uncharacterized protein n=1 Tax=Thalassococcus lentus TaxID=1210524 RepID=A0ABT4XSB8_9RHOB|nr:hypothetical protein [Thalassococcus lentus]MDA7424845.1 hypothetical protein [Thalassococcus lentus]